jgi:seryl-tRNA synthetase
MLNIKALRDNKAEIAERLKIRNIDAEETIEQILEMDSQKRALQTKRDAEQAQLNDLSKQIGKLFAQDKLDEANQTKAETISLKDSIKQLELDILKLDEEIHKMLVSLPNTPHLSVPKGRTPEDNLIVKEGGTIPDLTNPKPHWELIRDYGIIDFDLGVKITGAGFPVYIGMGAKLQRALINFFLEEGELAGYTEVLTPLLVNEASGFGTGQLPDKDGQMYKINEDNFYLIPTAEVPVTNIYRDVILNDEQLPVKNMAYSACFRREAGSWGADVRGLNRLHQFDKVEIVQITKPENSYKALDQMVMHVENLVKKLNLPYRILRLCGGDMGFTSALTYDFEVFSAAQEKWLEVSSVSNFEDFQTNRLKLRYKPQGSKKAMLAHSLNGSALALPRIMAAIIENNQTADGIVIPEVLRKFMHKDIISVE